MSERYNQGPNYVERHFSRAVVGENERSYIEPVTNLWTTFNAGDIVPINYFEVLPETVVTLDMIDSVIRQTTLLTPTMGSMTADFYAFFVPNRVVNSSTPYVFGENPNDSWYITEISYAPLISQSGGFTQVPVGSVADYYGFPTQAPIPNNILTRCNDLKFRGYIEIYNQFFRDQNYQPPIPYSKLNIPEGFFQPVGTTVGLDGLDSVTTISSSAQANGDVGVGAVKNALSEGQSTFSATVGSRVTVFSALNPPLKANKRHDYFTSCLPSPQKGPSVFASTPVSFNLPLMPVTTSNLRTARPTYPLSMSTVEGATGNYQQGYHRLMVNASSAGNTINNGNVGAIPDSGPVPNVPNVGPTNLFTGGSRISSNIQLSINDLRMAAAVQQVYELRGLTGTRYREYVKAFFGVEVDNPYKDIPTYLGHFSVDLDLYQTAQTAASTEGSTPQGNLAGFGYTRTGGRLVDHFEVLEHGYIHVFAVVRHNSIYSSLLSRDNFRLNGFDFYQKPLANISNQPVYTREINPFQPSSESNVFGYQEAWAEYRYQPDRVTGLMRPGVEGSLAIWNYADDFDSSLSSVTPSWLMSNSQAVLDRTLAVTSSVAPQFKGQFTFKFGLDLPAPIYSVPGMDIV